MAWFFRKARLAAAGAATALLLTGAAFAETAARPEGAVASCPGEPYPTPAFFNLAFEPVTIRTARGETHEFEAEIADTGETRNRGLMFRDRLADDEAMLFIYEQAQPQAAFWMKNTRIPLDIIFVSPSRKILNIAEMANPCDLSSLRSSGQTCYVLEVPGGLSKRLGLKPGDRLESPALRRSWPVQCAAP